MARKKQPKSIDVPILGTKSEPTRYRIMGDESGHDYFIPVHLEKMFEEWVASYEEGADGEYDGRDFSLNRIDGRFTFTDPRID